MCSKAGAAITLAGDMLKGVLPVVAARALSDDALVIALTGLAAFLGHLYPVFFGFKGGKGVATALGVYLGLNPLLAGAMIATWLIMAAVFRISSLSALTATALSPLYLWLLDPNPVYLVLCLVLAALMFWRHRSNIRKLLEGTEGRIGQRNAK
jgi:glycerol-3-phosphate acyltransferase PlsY